MKPKELQKKLTLKKQTISHLEDKEQDVIRGGASGATCWIRTCDSCFPTQCGNTCCGSVLACSC
jgi:hypothetical protein